MNRPLVSIIIRCFNEEKHIGKLLSEIARQKTSFEFETIVVDSGSTDNTLKILKNFKILLIKVKRHIIKE